MYNFPAEQLPRTWDDYFWHDAEVAMVKRWIAGAPDTLPQSLFITGPTGVGKTSLALLLLKSIRCLNRPKDWYSPCGECAVCTDETDMRYADRSTSNIHWIQPGGFTTETIDSAVKQALRAANQGPVLSGNPHRDILFIIFDEWHKIKSDLRQQILIRSEVETPHANVMYIFITMQEEDLPEEDRIALSSRGNRIKLLPLTESQIVTYLHTKYNQDGGGLYPHSHVLNGAAASLIAQQSRGSLRYADSHISQCMQHANGRYPITEETVALALKLTTWSERLVLWDALRDRRVSFKRLNNIIEQLRMQSDLLSLVRQLHEDLLVSIDAGPSEEKFVANQLFCQLMMNPRSCPLTAMLLQLRGQDLIQSNRNDNIPDYTELYTIGETSGNGERLPSLGEPAAVSDAD